MNPKYALDLAYRPYQIQILSWFCSTRLSRIWYVFGARPVARAHEYQVLFRNNFALSRDIASSFQVNVSYINAILLTHSKSFQSSTKVLDPALNPTLFQSTLAIIIKVRMFDTPLIQNSLRPIKDVIDSDTTEIVNE